MTNPTQINQGGAANQERQPQEQTGSQPSGQPVGGQWAKQQQQGMQKQQQAQQDNAKQGGAQQQQQGHSQEPPITPEKQGGISGP
jgi:hypothetical protein